MSEAMPYVAYRETGEDNPNPGFHVGLALNDLVKWARERGASEAEILERVEIAFDAYEAGLS